GPAPFQAHRPHRPAADRLSLRGVAALREGAVIPSAPVRRPLTITIWVTVSLLCLAVSCWLLALAALASALLRRPQPLLLTRLLVRYFAVQLIVLSGCALLWLVSGFGAAMRTPRFQAMHYRL